MKGRFENYVIGCLSLTCCLGSLSCSSNELMDSISTDFPTDEWVISDYIVTDSIFGAKAEKGFDNRAAFQAAIDSAYNNGGGVVYIPSGVYEFHTTQSSSMSVRVRKDNKETSESFKYDYVLKLRPGVQLRGDWADPEDHNHKVKGTVLAVYAGKDSPNCNGVVESWWNDPQFYNKLYTTYTSIADRFIEMSHGTGVKNMSIWYPEQHINDVKPYPWTLYQTGGNSATVENVTMVNSYNGFYSAPSELHYLKNNHITALNTGVEIHVCTDIGRIESVDIRPDYWTKSGLPGAPSEAELTSFTQHNATGFKMHRSDWEYIYGLSVADCQTGLWIGREPGFSNSPNSQLYQILTERCTTGLYVEEVNPYGLLISNSTFGTTEQGNAVYFHKDFKTSVQFNGVDFKGQILSDGSNGVISFESCSFDNPNDYSLKINNGNVLLTQCDFAQTEKHVFLGSKMKELKSVNSGHCGQLYVDQMNAATEVVKVTDEKYHFTPIPKNVATDITTYPKPSSSKYLKADLPKAYGFNNEVPSVDVSSLLQQQLDVVKRNGGGTLYLPAGRYLVESPIVIPSGVELRGSWDVQHHTQSGGTAIMTNYDGGEQGEAGEPLIQLQEKAGLVGLTIAQLNIVSDGCSKENPRKTPFLIQGKGPKVYVKNVTVAIGDKGLDLASYNTSGHYVDYFAGVLLRAGIWVGGGAEGGFVRNMQFNPHYSVRLPKGGQGFPSAGMIPFVQSHCSALKFADVKNETIFNNFVFGSVYGIHFLKDAITGKCPGHINMIGHGSDGCTFSLFVEDGDAHTDIVGINSELVNTNIKHQPVRSYVLLGKESNTVKINKQTRLTLYNSAFWGFPTVGSIVNNGILRLQQGNFAACGNKGIDIYGGEAYAYSTFFAQPMYGKGTYLDLHKEGNMAEFTNNFYATPLRPLAEDVLKLTGSDF